MDRPATDSTSLLGWMGPFALAVLIPLALLGSGWALFKGEKVRFDDEALVVTLHLGAEAPKYVPASSEFRGSRSYQFPSDPAQPEPYLPPHAVVEESALEPDTPKPVPDSKKADLEPTTSLPSPHQPEVQPIQRRRINLGAKHDPADIPIAPGSATPSPKTPNKKRSPLDEAILKRFGKRPSLHLPGKPYYPRSCRMGLCRNGVPCEGAAHWLITSHQKGTRPAALKQLSSAGCALLNASIKKFLEKSPMPKTGTFEVSIRFKITDKEK